MIAIKLFYMNKHICEVYKIIVILPHTKFPFRLPSLLAIACALHTPSFKILLLLPPYQCSLSDFPGPMGTPNETHKSKDSLLGSTDG